MKKIKTSKTQAIKQSMLTILYLWMGTMSLVAQVTLPNQAAVNNFPSSITSIKGSLNIGGSSGMSDITNLSPLANIQSVGGDLNITFNRNLTSLNGLDGIQSVGGSIFITNNAQLSNCLSVFGLIRSGGIIISNNKEGCNSGQEIIDQNNECGNPGNKSDSDNDGVLDCADGCPDNPYKIVNDACGCDGGYAGDSDGDGTIDCEDECPYDRNKIKVGNCGCGVSETPDSDGDGVYDCMDECPNNPYLIQKGLCGCEAPTITDVSMSNRSSCQDQNTKDANDDTYQATVTVEFAYPPQLGAIRFTGAVSHRLDFANENVSQTSFSFNFTFPADGQQVDFRVEYIGNETCNYWFRQATALAPCSDLVCDIPTNITTKIADNQAQLSWDYVADWMSYDYRYRPVGATEWTHQWTDQNEVVICDLATNQTYEYGVRAYCGANRKSTYSSQSFFTTDATQTTCVIDPTATACVIQNVEILDIHRCHDRGTAYQGDDFFYADVVVYFQQAPLTGTLNLMGNTIASVATSELGAERTYRFKRLKVMENYGKIDLTASFSEDVECQFNINYPITLNPCSQGRSRVEEEISIDPLKENERLEFSLAPNPVSEILTVSLPVIANGELIIFDILGKQVWQQGISDGIPQIDLQISHFDKGIYQLVIQNKEIIISEKFLKQ